MLRALIDLVPILLLFGASFLKFTLTTVGLCLDLKAFIEGLDLTLLKTIPVVVFPHIVPLVVAQGYHVIRFGILIIFLIEITLIMPPVGLDLYVLQGAHKSGSLNEVIPSGRSSVHRPEFREKIAFSGEGRWYTGTFQG